MEEFGLWLDGREVGALSGQTFESLDPAVGAPWCRVAAGSAADVDRAVMSATRAFEADLWQGMEPSARRALLLKIARVIRTETEALALIESRDSGKLLREAALHVGASAEWFEYFAGMTDKVCGDTIPSDNGVLNYTALQPLGVVGAIVPGNSPFLLTTWKLAPALAAGNVVVLKPSEYTSASIISFMRLLKDVLPPGVVNVVTGLGAEVGAALVAHPGIKKIAFTGGTVGGTAVASGAGKRLAPVILELGGKSANIVFADAVYEKALAGVMAGVFAATGQTCMAGSRVLIQRDIFDRFLADLAERASKIRVGHPAAPDTQVGPVGTAAQLERVEALVGSARDEGGEILAGGQRVQVPEHPGGYYYAATVISGVSNRAKICREEVFGPVMTCMPFDTEEEALDIANDSEFGLVAGLWTSNLFRAHRMSRELDVGTVFVNLYRKVAPQSPFGGRGLSGYGRENGFEVMREYTQVKSVLMDLVESRVQDPFVMRVGDQR